MGGGHPNVYLYCGNDAKNYTDSSGTDIDEANGAFRLNKSLIFRLAHQFGIQVELLAGVVFVECYSSGIRGGHALNRMASQHKFLLGFEASLGITQFKLDPDKLGLRTWLDRWMFINDFEQDHWAQLYLAAQRLRYLTSRPNRYPSRINRLTRQEMAIILTEYNKGETNTPACDAKPGDYGKTFLKHYDHIMMLLYGGIRSR